MAKWRRENGVRWNQIHGAPQTKAGRDRIRAEVAAMRRERAAALSRGEDIPEATDQELAEYAVEEQQREAAVQRAEQFSRLPFGARVRALHGRIEELAESYHRERVREAQQEGYEPPSLDESTAELAEKMGEDRESTLQELEEISPGLAEHIAALQAEAPVRISDAEALASHQFAEALRKLPPTSSNQRALQEAAMLASVDDNPEETAPLRAFEAIRQQGGTGALLDAMSIDEALALAQRSDGLRAREAPPVDRFKDIPTETLEGYLLAADAERQADQGPPIGEKDRAPGFVYENPTSKAAIEWMTKDMERMDREEAERNPKPTGDQWRKWFETA